VSKIHYFFVIIISVIYRCTFAHSAIVPYRLLETVHTSFIFIFAKFECSEHWRRLRDWSFCPSFRRSFCVHDDS